MSNTYLKNIIEIIEKYRKKNQRKLMVYGVFVVISTIFWLLSSLSDNYVTTIEYPIRFSNLPNSAILVNELPKQVDLKVESKGFTLLRYKLGGTVIPIHINLKNFTLQRDPANPSRHYILSRYTQQKISGQLNNELKVIEIQPDSFIFEFTEIVRKKIAIEPRLDYDLQKQFLVKKISCEPDSLLVTGPKTMIDTIVCLETKAQDFGRINQSIKRNIALEDIKGLKFDKKRITVNLDIEKYTESSFQLPVEILNAPEEFNIKFFPEKVNVSFLVAISDYDKVKPHHFKLVSDYEKQSITALPSGHKLKIELKKYPSFVTSINITPGTLDYLLEKK